MSLLLSTGAFASSLSGAAPGMVLVSPTSITHSGTSATLGANGQVTFSAVTSLSLNGVFSTDFDNYVMAYSVLNVGTAANPQVDLRLRAGGSDASGSDYTYQRLEAGSTVVGASRSTGQTQWDLFEYSDDEQSGAQIMLYGPNLAQPTAFRSITVDGKNIATIYDIAGTHSVSTAYDSFTSIFPQTTSGSLAVYGIRS